MPPRGAIRGRGEKLVAIAEPLIFPRKYQWFGAVDAPPGVIRRLGEKLVAVAEPLMFPRKYQWFW